MLLCASALELCLHGMHRNRFTFLQLFFLCIVFFHLWDTVEKYVVVYFITVLR